MTEVMIELIEDLMKFTLRQNAKIVSGLQCFGLSRRQDVAGVASYPMF